MKGLLVGLVIPFKLYMEFGVMHSSAYIDPVTKEEARGLKGEMEVGVYLEKRIKLYASHSSSLEERFDKGMNQVGVKLIVE